MKRNDTPEVPRIWAITGDRPGDNAQVEALVDALCEPVARRYVRVVPPWNKRKPRVRPTLHHIDSKLSDPLTPPWPDLIITVGRRLAMVALWVKEQSGGATRIVFVGKPSGSTRPYDLIVTSSEVQIAPASNVLRIALPLLQVDEEKVRAAQDAWREKLRDLPRPLVGVLVGGPTNPFTFNRRVVRDLIRLATGIREKQGGTAYFSTSPRTPDHAIQALRAGLPEDTPFFRWRPDAPDNPYSALLGAADGFIVTGDSVSMLVEVARLHKPLAIYPLPYGALHRFDQLRRRGARWLYEPDAGSALDGFRRDLRSAGKVLHVLPRTRDFTAIHQLLIDRGLAVLAGEDLTVPRGEVPNDLPLVVARIRALLASTTQHETSVADGVGADSNANGRIEETTEGPDQ